jgi:hypothetical protein
MPPCLLAPSNQRRIAITAANPSAIPRSASATGDRAGTAADAVYVNAAGNVAPPQVVVTTRSAEPAAPAGVVAVIVVALTTTMFVADTPRKVTVAGAVKNVPVIVTFVPPAVDPVFGVTDVTVGKLHPALRTAGTVKVRTTSNNPIRRNFISVSPQLLTLVRRDPPV